MSLINSGVQPRFGYKNNRRSRREPFSPLQWALVFFLLLIIFYAIELLWIKPVDGINDDWGMYSILSGAYTGTPDAHVMFFLYPLAWLLSKLYTLYSPIPWYGLFQHIVQIAGLFAVYQRSMRIRVRHNPQEPFYKSALIGFLFLFYIVDLNVLSEAQYTTTAGLAAATALFCFATARINQSKLGFFLDNIPSLLFAWISFCMRQNIFYLMVPMAGMLWLSKWILSRKSEYEDVAAKLLGVALLLLLGMGILWGINAAAYASPEWSDIRKINHY
ncbi:MAG: hypothetical protein K2N37_00990, partial [Lachnospiraceae bacterium]|nr:hypothetical protein [Lachnospiraceae bacterium]